MSYKYYGRLIGKIYTDLEALTGTSPANTTTPFNEQSPGTKFMAYGEDATSLAFNRAMGALATNLDHISGTLGAPALRSEMLRPYKHDESAGFTSLEIEEAGQTTLSLGAGTGQNTEPPVWVYCGFSKESLSTHVKLFHVDGEIDGLPSNRANLENRSTFTNYTLAPIGCAETTGGSDYFSKPDGTPQAFYPDKNTGMPLFIPPIRRVVSDILPYGGATQLQFINSWDPDGLYMRGETVGNLCLRPGCFVEVRNNGNPDIEQDNNGLFRIESIANNTDTDLGSTGSKLVLTRGNLHRVTVSNGAPYTAGELVSWQSRPNHGADSSAAPNNRTNFAHIMYIIARPDLNAFAADLYLASASGPDSFDYDGFHTASKIAPTAPAANISAVSNYGSVGLADQEEDAEDNWSLPIGTFLYNATSTQDPLNSSFSEVTHVIPAGYPIVFTTLNTPGQLYPCTPPGFLLNPQFTFESDLLPGNNYLWAKTLTTVGEQLRSQTGGYLASASEDASSEPYQTRQDVIATEVLLGHIHQGSSVVAGSDVLNQPKSPTANILGPSLWRVTVEKTQGPDSFAFAFEENAGTLGQDFARFVGNGGFNVTVARPIIEHYDADTLLTSLVLSDVASLHSHKSDFSKPPLEVGYFMTLGTNTFNIVSIEEAPYILDVGSSILPTKGDSHDNKFVMGFGLNAAFHAHGSASEFLRSRNMGFGNQIFVPGGTRSPDGAVHPDHLHRPFTTILEGIEPFEIAHLTVSDHASVGIAELYETDGTPTARIRHDATTADGTLTFADKNTMNNPGSPAHGGDIPFSSTERSEDDHNVMHNLRDLPSEVRHRSILGTLESLLQGNYEAGDSLGTHSYGALSNGVFYGAEVICRLDEDNNTGPENFKEFPLWEEFAFQGTDTEIAIAEAYYHEFGAKTYAPSATMDLAEFLENDVLVYWNITTQQYGREVVLPAHMQGAESSNFTTLQRIPIACVRLDAGGIVEVVDIRQRICHQDQRNEIYVGRATRSLPTSSAPFNILYTAVFRQGAMHFPTIGHAVKAIEKWSRHYPDGRSWTIKVVGPTQEVSTPHRGLELPIKMPCDSIRIEGLGARSQNELSRQFIDYDGTKVPLITVHGRNTLFDLNSCSNISFSNLSIEFSNDLDDGGVDDRYTVEPTVNVFMNSRSALMSQYRLAAVDAGVGSEGRTGGGFYTNNVNKAYQENIFIERVQVRGPHHCFFWHGPKDGNLIDPADAAEVPFDNLTIRDCINDDGYHGFVILAPHNATFSPDVAALPAIQTPHYWRNINIINCRSVNFEHDGTSIGGTGYYFDTKITTDGIHLAACKEVVIRDCYLSNHIKGITFGLGDGSHSCTGVIENNKLVNLHNDGITALSLADRSAIRITGNHISGYGAQIPTVETRNNVYVAPNRYAAIRIGGNEILVDNNFIDAVGGSEGTNETVRSIQGILITPTIAAAANYFGVRITNNVMQTPFVGVSCIRGINVVFDDLVVSGNTYTITHEDAPFSKLVPNHPVHDSTGWSGKLGSYFDDVTDAFALKLESLNNSTINNNTFHGHVAIKALRNASITDNILKYPSVIVSVAQGSGFVFDGNNLNNGMLVFHGDSANIDGNNFCNDGKEFDYPDIYNPGFIDAVYQKPGVYVQLEDTVNTPKPYAIVSNNTFRATPKKLWYETDLTSGVEHGPVSKTLPAIISVTQIDPEIYSKAVINGNLFIENGTVYVEAGTETTITGNEIATEMADYDTGETNVSVAILNTIMPEGTNSVPSALTDGRRRSNINVSDNNLGGSIFVNGCDAEFKNWNEFITSLSTGNRPDDGSGWPRNGLSWNSHQYGSDVSRYYSTQVPGTQLEKRHNKVSNVSITGNSIFGNIEMIGVRDSNIVNNRLAGLALIDDYTDTAFQNYSQKKDLFIRGQIALLSCKRVQISNCKLADLFMMYSSSIQCSDSIVGHSYLGVDDFGYYRHGALGTYASTDRGRVFAAYSHNITIDTCQLNDGGIDRIPNRTVDGSSPDDNHPRYMDDPHASVYSSIDQSMVDGVINSQQVRLQTRDFKSHVCLGAIATPAMTVSNCHVAVSQFSGCDDLKITNNRFYYGGANPADNLVLVINEGSNRPCVQNNHFTSSVVIGDPAKYRLRYGKNNEANAVKVWHFYVEDPFRNPVHAQVTGNRFDSAVEAGFDEWPSSETDHNPNSYGCGNLTIYNYGGSLIANNHLMKSPYGYMMHSGTVNMDAKYQNLGIPHEGFEGGRGSAAEDLIINSRADLRNRIGGRIELDPFQNYNPIYYTRGYVFGHLHPYSTNTYPSGGAWYEEHEGPNNPSDLNDDQLAAQVFYHVGTGVPNFDAHTDFYNELQPNRDRPWNRQVADAPQPWRYRLWTSEANDFNVARGLIENLGTKRETQDIDNNTGTLYPFENDGLDFIPWGGTTVYNWFATSEMIYRKIGVVVNDETGSKLFAHRHFPKTLGAFVVGNVCKDVVMQGTLRQSSWAFGRHCDLRIDRWGQGHLPAQAFETPLNPMHANNHVQFNMLRAKTEHLDLAVYGNFGSYVIKSNYDLDQAYGPQRTGENKIHSSLGGEMYAKQPTAETTDFVYQSLSTPVAPSDRFYMDVDYNGDRCRPWLERVPLNEKDQDGTPSTSCLLAGTVIETSRGDIPVEEVQKGDKVRSYNFETQEFGLYDVVELMEPRKVDRWVEMTTNTGLTLHCSISHPLYSLATDNNELPVLMADEMGATIYVETTNGIAEDKISSVVVHKESVTVYNFEVDGVHSYLSNGILSHNKQAGGNNSGTAYNPDWYASTLQPEEPTVASPSSEQPGDDVENPSRVLSDEDSSGDRR